MLEFLHPTAAGFRLEPCLGALPPSFPPSLPPSGALGSLGTSLREGEHKGGIESARSEAADKAAFMRGNGLPLSAGGVPRMNLHEK